jgi:cytochrome c peroxidase
MKLSFKIGSLFLLLSWVLVHSCSKDDKIEGFKATPYVIPTKPWYPQLKLPNDNPLTEEGVLLGRMLFYDPILSADSSISCSSCHKQIFGFTDNLAVSKGINNQLLTRNSMPLHNLMWNNFFFWDGRTRTLREQVLIPIQSHNEMALDLYTAVQKLQASTRYNPLFKKAFDTDKINPELIAKSLEQFLVTMVSFDSPIDRLKTTTDTLSVISESALRGMKLFLQTADNGGADCFHCHSNLPFFGRVSVEGSMTNNGLDEVFTDKGFGNVTNKPTDNGKFKIPNLRNVEMTAPYMHDGRFKTLEEVLDFYGGGGVHTNSPNIDNDMIHTPPLSLTQQQRDDIVEFLRALTDQNFLKNKAFSNPF